MNIIETRQLSKEYGGAMCVKDLDLKVPEGAIYGFLGPNGAGKSTTIRMLLGLARPAGGEISIFGQQMTAKTRLGILRQVGSLVEAPCAYQHLTGEENLKVVQTMRGLPKSHIEQALKIVRLEGQRTKKVSQYSLGMKQRLGLAAALMGFPRLLILDEPTNGLDPAGIQEMRELILALPKKYGMTVMVSSHLLSEIEQTAGHVGIIRSGELVYQGSMDALRGQCEVTLALRTLDNRRAAELIASDGIGCRRDGDSLMLPSMPDAGVAGLLDRLSASGIGVARLEERRRSLEDIFLDITGAEVAL